MSRYSLHQPDSEEIPLAYKNEPRAKSREEIDERLRRLGELDPRAIDDLSMQLHRRGLDEIYLDDALLWKSIRKAVKLVLRVRVRVRIRKERASASSSSTTADSKLLETEKILESSSSTPIAAHLKEDQDPRFFISRRAARKSGIDSKLKKLYEIQARYLEVTGFKPHSGNFWELACYPMKSAFIKVSLLSELKPLLKSTIPKYPEDLKEVVSLYHYGRLRPQPPDLVSLLSSSSSSSSGGSSVLVRNHGNEEVVVLDADTFRGKYVLVCCFHVPVLWKHSSSFQALISLYEELYATQTNFLMVVVARMNMLADTQAVFDHFFSGMPSSCLAVPYKDFKLRELICKLIGLDPSISLEGIQGHFVGPDGRVLTNPFYPFILNKYGAEAFPFGLNDMNRVTNQRKKMLADGKLVQLLKPPKDAAEDDVVVCQFNPGGAPQRKPLLGVTGGKHAGLYICCVGSLVPVLRQVHDECRQNNCHFEVVVLFCPSFEGHDPKLHGEDAQNVREPWRSRLVVFAFQQLDKLLIVGGDGLILDVYGAEVIHSCIKARSARVTDSHPFTRQAHVDGLVSRLREITLNSLLDGPLHRGEGQTTVQELLLKGCKKIIVLMDYLRHVYHKNFLHLKDRYQELKQEHGDEFEVVFFPAAIGDYESAVVREMPWYVYPVDGSRSPSFLKLTRTLSCRALYGFGGEGKLCSYESICKDGVDLRLTNDITLPQDIYRMSFRLP